MRSDTDNGATPPPATDSAGPVQNGAPPSAPGLAQIADGSVFKGPLSADAFRAILAAASGRIARELLGLVIGAEPHDAVRIEAIRLCLSYLYGAPAPLTPPLEEQIKRSLSEHEIAAVTRLMGMSPAQLALIDRYLALPAEQRAQVDAIGPKAN
jgi:hypothetical protein